MSSSSQTVGLSSLQKRVLTALVLAPLVVAAVLYLPSVWLSPVIAFVVLIGAWELAALAGVRAPVAKISFVCLVAGLILWAYSIRPDEVLHRLVYVSAAWWLAVTFGLLLTKPAISTFQGTQPLLMLIGGLLLMVACLSLVALHERAPGLMMFLLLLIWVADSAAYFTGRAFGKHKLAPTVSPGKTREGVYGALVGALACGILLKHMLLPMTPLLTAILICMLTVLVSVGGDLAESLVKRRANMKDSGQLLPGHGGMLDRIDSLLAAAPFFITSLTLVGANP